MSPESFSTRSFRFATNILQFYRVLNQPAADVPKAISYQMLRAGMAIGANIEEARSAQSRRDLAAKYTVALREARECHYWLRLVAVDRPRFADDAAILANECNELVALLTATVKKLRG